MSPLSSTQHGQPHLSAPAAARCSSPAPPRSPAPPAASSARPPRPARPRPARRRAALRRPHRRAAGRRSARAWSPQVMSRGTSTCRSASSPRLGINLEPASDRSCLVTCTPTTYNSPHCAWHITLITAVHTDAQAASPTDAPSCTCVRRLRTGRQTALKPYLYSGSGW